ncbi:phage tail tape measure C-terminal domain-containing protein [Hyphobacterium marinum]|uniref:Phage tail tape measure C-terminal domain-containing protein n=1 Tax=Hyphobacterium marinum TaxID=3116574 RepID=A0ABU7M1Q6_9PROT|nr:phage tail tape measure C-terminal domain-containing protein [Hyphobacterium sp. Y6023]MEE2567325.1 phage tail tape measure C-terminal domain-containing protein [Hyphobacterium sp. Y6023]
MTLDDDETERIAANAERAGEALRALADGPGREASESLSRAFERAGSSIESALSRAARTGELSFSAMADAIVRDLSRLAVDRFVTGPIEDLIGSLASGLPFFGARADGGPVVPGGAYLVGERGPEMFTPASAGQVGAAAPITVNITLAGGADPARLRRSETQIATALARAVAKGARHL